LRELAADSSSVIASKFRTLSRSLQCARACRAIQPLAAALALVVTVHSFAATAAQAPDATASEFFEKRIRPLLTEQCFECHSHQAKKIKGGLVLDSREGLLAGGDTGAAIVPGEPDQSLLVKAIRYTDPDLQMPPTKGERKKLSDDQIALLTEWVKMGAPWSAASSDTPVAGKMKARPRGKITDEDRKWWAFQPVREPAVPARSGDTSVAANRGDKSVASPWNPIDAFVLQKLVANGLVPSPEAERRVLIRRVYFDMLGLPPSPEEVDAFVADESADAYEKLIDRVLTSPHYGERWARQWLDLVRYADSDGYRIDDYRPLAWRYRDYVIRSFNDDKPYDRFVKEQLAGDELFPQDPDALIATGYLRHWIYEYNNRDVRGQWTTILNDITDTTGDVFLGLGVQCARCHDHKFDPILQKDYFRLQAFFAPILPREDLVAATEAQRAEHAAKLELWEEKTADIRAQIDEVEQRHRVAAERDAVKKFPDELQAMIRKPVAERTPLEHQLAELAYRQVYYEYNRLDQKMKGDDKEKVLALRRQLAEFDKIKPEPLPVAVGVSDAGPNAPPVFIPKKENLGAIEPGFPTVLDPDPAKVEPIRNPQAPIPVSTGRRAALAEWLTRPDNPLTARVVVNRVWQQHFGRGLAANASDFGKLGEAPTHPELLDWLAARFVADGWSLKKLHRLILTSATYRQGGSAQFSVLSAQSKTAGANSSTTEHWALSTEHFAKATQTDPENKLLWRAPVRRLDAEQIRDALFAVSGELKLDAGGPGVNGSEPRRSIYTKIMRNTRDPLYDVFDAPFWFTSASSRNTTTTPVQSLFLINSQLMLQRGKAFAARIERESGSDDAGAIARAYRLAFGRAPTADETDAALAFLRDQQARIDPEKAGSAKAAFVHDKIPYRDGQAAVLAPHSPQSRFDVPNADALPAGDFTIEAFVVLRSIYDSGSVRTIAAKWNGDPQEPGWGFGVTGKKSRRKPETLVMQIYGKKLDGSFGEQAVFSDQNIEINKPYYLAASVKLAGDGPGKIRFFVKDLSNDEEPLLTAEVEHTITGGYANDEPFTIGGRPGTKESWFDGLIDDVRLSSAPLRTEQLLFTKEGTARETVGYWRFEPKPGVFRDSSEHGLDITPAASTAKKIDVHKAALADFCHVLLNSNEFLYVE
jgi:uncharacterized protein DUF1549/uncharacterized protein DUF1553/cytochrome c/concanavalin A-like lectin/glucanase superfamily protein